MLFDIQRCHCFCIAYSTPKSTHAYLVFVFVFFVMEVIWIGLFRFYVSSIQADKRQHVQYYEMIISSTISNDKNNHEYGENRDSRRQNHQIAFRNEISHLNNCKLFNTSTTKLSRCFRTILNVKFKSSCDFFFLCSLLVWLFPTRYDILERKFSINIDFISTWSSYQYLVLDDSSHLSFFF